MERLIGGAALSMIGTIELCDANHFDSKGKWQQMQEAFHDLLARGT